jgi:type I restriction enzyme S subunit
MSFPRYPKYKDSGVAWLGEVPAHWEVCLLRRKFRSVDYGISDALDLAGRVAILRMGNIENGKVVTDDLKYTDAVDANLLLARGDLLYNRTNSLDLVGKVGLFIGNIETPVSFASYLVRLRVVDECLPEYFAYLLNTDGILGLARASAFVAIGQCNLNPSRYGQIPVAVPPLSEQALIVEHLDRETAKIDALVAEQQRLIELLKEKRQAVISHAITKGLNPKVPMKPSGVEWLGEIPAYWNVVPLKWLTDPERPIMYGIVLPGMDVGDGVPILKGGNVKPSRMNLESMARTTPEIEAPYARARLKAGDLVYSIRGSIGDCEPVPAELEGANITQDVARVAIASSLHAGWARWALLAPPVREELASGSLGAAVRGINIFDLKRARIPTPPLAEQMAIASILDTATRRFDELVAAAQCAIDLLQERRSALISAAVTGQIDVRGLAERTAA